MKPHTAFTQGTSPFIGPYIGTGARPSVTDLVINWHVTEACNYRCKYCYAKWTPSHLQSSKEVHRDQEGTHRLLKNLFEFFAPTNMSNPLAQSLSWKNVRLSIAGGEPTLLRDRLNTIIGDAKQLGFEISLITNGSLLDARHMELIAPQLSCLGISLDSPNVATNRSIGRINDKGDGKSVGDIIELIGVARKANPSIKIKVNTVVNAINAHENMTDLISRAQPDRWKVLRALPVISEALSVTEDNFSQFVARHAMMSSVMSVEDNTDMVESYIMIDPLGRFFQNSPGCSAYSYSSPIQEIGAEAAFSQIEFSPEKFANRYMGLVEPSKETSSFRLPRILHDTLSPKTA
jgi:radical S-adenosyl methionine domain-containing protein 2